MLLGPVTSDELWALSDRCDVPTYRVAEESWTPSSVDSTEAFSTANLTPCLKVPGIHFRVDLTAAFDKIEGRHGRVGDTTSQEASESTCCVVFRRV